MPSLEVEHLQKNDIGTILYMEVTDEDGAVVNISTATLLKMAIRKPASETVAILTAIPHDAPNGIMKYILVSGDIDEIGLYQIQGFIEMPAWQGRTDTQYFYVEDNLIALALHAVESYLEGV